MPAASLATKNPSRPARSIQALKEEGKLDFSPDNRVFSLKNWISSAHELQHQADSCESTGDVEKAYVSLLKVVSICLFLTAEHPEGKIKPTPAPLASLFRTATSASYKSRLKSLEQTISDRLAAQANLISPELPDLPSLSSSSAMSSNSPSSPEPRAKPLSIKERMAALKGAGMDASSVYSAKEPSPTRKKEESSSSISSFRKEPSDSAPPRLQPTATPSLASKPSISLAVSAPSSPAPPPSSSPIPSQVSEPEQPPSRPSAPVTFPESTPSISQHQQTKSSFQSQLNLPLPPSQSLAPSPQPPLASSHSPSHFPSVTIPVPAAPTEPPFPAPKPMHINSSHSYSASLPSSRAPSRHSSPPPISVKPPSLANYTPPSRSGEFTPTNATETPNHSVPSTPILEFPEPKDFSSHFPSLSEFESLPELRVDSPAAGSRALPSVPSHPPGSRSNLHSTRQSISSASHTPSISPNHTAASVNSLASSSSSQHSTSSPQQQFSTSPTSLSSSFNGLSISPSHSSPHSVSPSHSLPSSSSAPAKLEYPFAIRIDPSELSRYLSDPRAKLLILDVRPREAFEAGHIGQDKQEQGRIQTINIEPSWLDDYGVTGAALHPRISSPPAQEAFSTRNAFDLVVIYQSSLAYPPTSAKGSTPAEKLATALYEREFSSRSLQRSPVVLNGGWEAWETEKDGPGLGLTSGTNGSLERGIGASPGPTNGMISPPPTSGEFQSRPLPRTTRLPPRQGSGLADLIELESPAKPTASSSSSSMANRSPYLPHIQTSLPRPLPSSPQPPHQYGHQPSSSLSSSYQPSHSYGHQSSSLSYPYASSSSSSSSAYALPPNLASPPPSASISRTPLSRRRSDYADQASQSYSGYSPHHASRPSIDYPNLTPGAYNGGASGSGSSAGAYVGGQSSLGYGSAPGGGGPGASLAGGIPQPPPVAATPSLERHNSRSSLVRSSSITLPSGQEVDQVSYWGNEIVGMSGLKNLGNTCYQNSTLQCLSATAPFTKLFIDGRWKRSVNTTNPLGTKGNLASAYSSLVTALWRQEYDFIQPLSFRKSIVKFAPSFDGNEQHDSQEFLAFLLDGLHEDLNRIQVRPPSLPMTAEREAELNTLPTAVAGAKEWKAYQSRNDSLVVDWFQGQYRSRVECTSCHQTSTTFDSFMYLSLPVPTSRLKSRVSLGQCLDQFTAEEVMEKGNAWNCPKCKKPRTATKSLQLSRLPPVLLIHLKRFSSKNGLFWDKAETLVEFPVRGLDLTKYLPSSGGSSEVTKYQDDPRVQKPPFMYELYGVSNHMGSLSSGHYTAYVKSSQRNWKYCDDRTITEAHERDVMTKNAYILFYRRVPSVPTF